MLFCHHLLVLIRSSEVKGIAHLLVKMTLVFNDSSFLDSSPKKSHIDSLSAWFSQD